MRVLVALLSLVLLSCAGSVLAQEEGGKPRTLSGPKGSVWAIAFSPDGSMLAAASDVSKNTMRDGTETTIVEGGEILIWNVRQGTLHSTLKASHFQVMSVAFASDGKTLAAGTFDEIGLWDVTTGKLKQRLEGFKGQPPALAFSADGKVLVSINSWFDKNELRLWDARTGELLRTVTDQENKAEFKALALSRDGKTIVTGSALPGMRGEIKTWDADSGTLKLTIPTERSVDAVALSPDGDTLASPISSAINFWDARTGLRKKSIDAFVSRVAYTPDGSRLLTMFVNEVMFIDLKRGEVAKKLRARAHCFALSPDGLTLAIGHGDDEKGAVVLWDLTKQP